MVAKSNSSTNAKVQLKDDDLVVASGGSIVFETGAKLYDGAVDATSALKGAALSVTDGTHTVANVGTLSTTTGTVGGSGGSATIDFSGGGGGDCVKIAGASGTITGTATQFIDLTFPAGYERFGVLVENAGVSSFTPLAAAMVIGGTVVNDVGSAGGGGSSYVGIRLQVGVSNLSMGSGSVSATNGKGPLASISGYMSDPTISAPWPSRVTLDVSQKTQSLGFNGLSSYTYGTSVHGGSLYVGSAQTNPAATTPASAGRVEAVRILPLGNGDADPPTSGITLSPGTIYTTWGYK